VLPSVWLPQGKLNQGKLNQGKLNQGKLNQGKLNQGMFVCLFDNIVCSADFNPKNISTYLEVLSEVPI
jgi:hypothetical protein